MNLNELSKEIYEANKLKGFDVKECNIGQTLMLIVSELSEALEADRKGKRDRLKVFEQELRYARLNVEDYEPENENFKWITNRFETTIKDTFEDEIADTFIRVMDLVGALDIDIEKHIYLKRMYNSQRQFKHGKAY